MRDRIVSSVALIGLGLVLTLLANCGLPPHKKQATDKGGAKAPPAGIPKDWDGTADYPSTTWKVTNE